MRIVPNSAKEASNRRKHALGFSRAGEIPAGGVVDDCDDRPLGYEQEGRVRLLGRLGERVVVLVFEPVELRGGEFGVKPVSLRRAEPHEARDY